MSMDTNQVGDMPRYSASHDEKKHSTFKNRYYTTASIPHSLYGLVLQLPVIERQRKLLLFTPDDTIFHVSVLTFTEIFGCPICGGGDHQAK